jgi:hypothetical protein
MKNKISIIVPLEVMPPGAHLFGIASRSNIEVVKGAKKKLTLTGWKNSLYTPPLHFITFMT